MTDSEKDKAETIIYTTNEVANIIGVSYKTIQKDLAIRATKEEIRTGTKYVRNRALTGYYLSIRDLQSIKDKYRNLDFQNAQNDENKKMLANALNTNTNTKNPNENPNELNVKIYEVMTENTELKKKIESSKAQINELTNVNARLDANLIKASAELKLIEDKSKTIENSYFELKQEKEKLSKVLMHRNIALIILGAVLLMIVTVLGTVHFIR